ncbi:MAG: hypothetical protein COU33_01695 [Candidatus Magasanikbacteria bacterium CG10_big_fil_rev_8_21_14_0_10_43_6]|uniref:Uncharacterized protein n=1 Tax=Candidatus Magasanikbacteria bacterium CG10_big_fil_rev_8_21_14_0_10_43_6 TaxID=1974650 RepID=A0A2M6W1V8_9BACT|nr:MAG: hypothetical protein COU33_01695 [Candidatus Magasanikbacteria bacterium CG10_big_fil_rev_8_21_14_0_10_43_6]
MIRTLSTQAAGVITHYEHLVIGGKKIRCPYFNNKKTNVRAALRVLVGKGTPHDIEEEAMIISLKEKVHLATLDEHTLRTFLIDYHLGVDCSGFAYHVLDAELQQTKHASMKRTLTFPLAKNIFRKSISKLRSAESCNVQTLAHEKNSLGITLHDIAPADMIIMIETGQEHTLDHVLVVTDVTYNETQTPTTIGYAHSLNWKKDGPYNHGIRRGTITVTDSTQSLLNQIWNEDGETTKEKNETYWRARTANRLDIRRLR